MVQKIYLSLCILKCASAYEDSNYISVIVVG